MLSWHVDFEFWNSSARTEDILWIFERARCARKDNSAYCASTCALQWGGPGAICSLVCTQCSVNSWGETTLIVLLLCQQAEGIEKLYSQSVLLDLTDNKLQTTQKTLSFSFPPNTVGGSERVQITAIGKNRVSPHHCSFIYTWCYIFSAICRCTTLPCLARMRRGCKTFLVGIK